MRTALLSLTFLLAGSMAAPAFAHTAAPKKKVTATTKKGKILPMKEYIDQLMAKMTLQEKIGQLNLMVAGDITTGGALDTQVGGDIGQLVDSTPWKQQVALVIGVVFGAIVIPPVLRTATL